jgi:DNA-3-methyladenine glycosylase II
MTVGRIIETPACVAEGASYLATVEPRFAEALALTGPLPLRRRKDGFGALLDAIVSQQVSVAAADAILGRLKAAGYTSPRSLLAATDEELRACGLSRQKARNAGYGQRTRSSPPSSKSPASAAGRPRSTPCSRSAAPT